jgi:hypothetical protein
VSFSISKISDRALRIFLGFSLLSSACSKEQESKPGEKVKVADLSPEETPSDKPVEVRLTSGIPDFCAITERNEFTCVRCISREIPILKCSDKKVKDLKVGENCVFDAEKLRCAEPASGLDLALDHTKPSVKEKYYTNIEQVIGGLKFIVGATLKNEGEDDRILFFALMDGTIQHKKSIFLGTDRSVAVDAMWAPLLAKNPEMTDEQKARVRANAAKAIEYMASDIDESENNTEGIIRYITNIIEAVKIGNEGSEFNNVRIDKLIETMNSPKYRTLIDELLKGFIAQ